MNDAIAVPLGRSGLVAWVDAIDYPSVAERRWGIFRHRISDYAWSSEASPRIFLHRFVLGLPPNHPYVDHRDGDGLNNRRSNLRIATNAENLRNRGRQRNNTSGYKGVWWRPPRNGRQGSWIAEVRAGSVRRSLSGFADPMSAARAYDDVAREMHGEFARLNFPDPE